MVRCSPDAVFAHRVDWEGSTILVVHNLGAEPVTVRLSLDDGEDVVGYDDLLHGGEVAGAEGSSDLDLDLDRYGYRWLRVLRRGGRRTP